MAKFGDRFKLLRQEKQLTQQQLVDEINKLHNLTLGKSSISLYENNKGTPETLTLERFADYFNVSLDYLMGRSDIKNPTTEIYNSAFHSISTKGLSEEEKNLLENMVEQFKKNKKLID